MYQKFAYLEILHYLCTRFWYMNISKADEGNQWKRPLEHKKGKDSMNFDKTAKSNEILCKDTKNI